MGVIGRGWVTSLIFAPVQASD